VEGVNQFRLRRLFLVGPELLRLPVGNAPLLTAGGGWRGAPGQS
jgi:hypothetical protein